MNCIKIKMKMCTPYEHITKNLNFEQLLKHSILNFRRGELNFVGETTLGLSPSNEVMPADVSFS